MSVRYTATWYDVTQARQQDTHHTHRHVPARPAGLQFSHSHRHTAGRGGGRLNCMYIECVSAKIISDPLIFAIQRPGALLNFN
jgi:hypothetical protein